MTAILGFGNRLWRDEDRIRKEQLDVNHLFMLVVPGGPLGLTTDPQSYGVAESLRTFAEVAREKYGVDRLVIGLYSHFDCGAHGGVAAVGNVDDHIPHFTKVHIEAMAAIAEILSDYRLEVEGYIVDCDGVDTILDQRTLR